ncbi:hypothetical protein SDC9_53064 [bioreactor metagenome]|uniref:Uncharacterized protein n=1 Tax=bioreactor metagenome TaxID=1076179 RepID=A0A644WT99_9ZZZZ
MLRTIACMYHIGMGKPTQNAGINILALHRIVFCHEAFSFGDPGHTLRQTELVGSILMIEEIPQSQGKVQ